MNSAKHTTEQIATMLRNADLNWKMVTRQLGASDVTTLAAKKEVMKLRKALKNAASN